MSAQLTTISQNPTPLSPPR